MKRPITRTRTAILVTTLALAGVACAGDDETADEAAEVADDVSDSVVDAVDEATDDALDDDGTAAAEAALTDPAVEESVVTFLGLLAAADALPGDGDVTLFVPTDAAFASAAIDNFETLLADPVAIGDVLGAHAAEGVVMSGDLADGDMITPVVGDPLMVTIAGDSVMVGDATVVQADIEFEGGVIHVIDSVLTLPG